MFVYVRSGGGDGESVVMVGREAERGGKAESSVPAPHICSVGNKAIVPEILAPSPPVSHAP